MKRIPWAYFLSSGFFLLTGFLLIVLIRWQLAFPGKPLPFTNWIMSPEVYNQLGALHGTLMIFLGIVPLGTAAFGQLLVPRMLGLEKLQYDRLSWTSFYLFLVAGFLMIGSFFSPSGAARSGWTSYTPLSVVESGGQTVWLVGIFLVGVSSILHSINMIATVMETHVGWQKLKSMPFFVWTQLVSALLLLLAFPPLLAAGVMQLSDRLLRTNFFLPAGLVISGEALNNAGGGETLLWQHLFWFLGHPEVYVLILPAFGIVADLLSFYSKNKVFGQTWMIRSVIFLGVASMLVWAHHMFLTGMSSQLSRFFMVTTMLVSIPSVVIGSCLLFTLFKANFEFKLPMLFALAFLPMFGIGGLTGIPLGLGPTNAYLHDSYYVIAHFHYLVGPAVLIALFGGIYHFVPLTLHKQFHEGLGKIHFWLTLIAMNVTFAPLFLYGLGGVSRRLYDPTIYEQGKKLHYLSQTSSYGSWLLLAAQIPFILNVIFIWRQKRTEAV